MDFSFLQSDLLRWLASSWLAILIWIVVIYFAIRWGFKLFHLWLNAHEKKNLVFMKVVLSRSDSASDKEKQTKKDFREVTSVMQQLYRALYEIRELNMWNRLRASFLHTDRISFEMFLEKRELFFYVVTFPYYRSIVEKQITTFYPDAEIEYTKPPQLFEEGYDIKGYSMTLDRDFYFPIKTYKTVEEDPLNDLSNVLDKLELKEKAAIQMVLRPKSGSWRAEAKAAGTAMFKGKRVKSSFLKKIPLIGGILHFLIAGAISTVTGKTNAPGASGGDSYVRMLATEEEAAKAVGEKASQVGFDAYVRIFASSPDGDQRVDDILNNMVVSFNVFSNPKGNTFQNRRIFGLDFINTPLLLSAYEQRSPGILQKPNLMVPEELATLYHFPNSIYNKIPILHWKSYKVLAPPVDLPNEGIVVALSNYRGVKRAVRFKRNDRTRHQYIIGKSGAGKSALLHWQARQDIWNGDGVGVVDPHGDLVETILTYVPKSRARDVIVFDPSVRERPMGLNLLEAKTEEEKDRASLDATEIFIKLFGDEIFGPRIQHYFRNACLTLMSDPDEGATLIDVPRMFTDEEFMKYKVSKVTNSVVRSFWEHEYANTGERERQEMIPYFSSKFGPFITNTTMRNVIGQSKSAFNIRDCMDTQKVLLVNLSKGKIGDLNAQLLGLVLVNKLSMAAMSRADMPEKERKDFYLYVDEFQNFATDTFATILSEARKYRLNLIMAHQYINQLVVSKFGNTSTQIRDAVFGNVGSLMSFKVGAEDAEYLQKEYAPLLSVQDIIGIANYKAYMKLNINNTTSRPFSVETIWDERGKNPKIAEILKQYSQLRYGRKKVFVDQEIEARLGIQ